MQAECLFERGQYADALTLYGQARERKPSSQQMVTLCHLHAGQAAAQLQRWSESRQWLDAVSNQDPESPSHWQILYELAVAEQNLGELALAEPRYRLVADKSVGQLAARARFMLGELLFARQNFEAAIHEFRKLMYGFDASIHAEVANWQAKAGIEAGQCAAILASQQSNLAEQQRFLELGTRCLEYVQTRHPGTDEAVAASEQLKKYGVTSAEGSLLP
jgi:TolA-binding protein